MTRLLFHGGVAGQSVGSVLVPGMAAHRYVKGCKHCEAQAAGVSTGIDPPTPEGWLYATADKPYARWYASRAVHGTLYRVRLEGDVEPSIEDPPWSHTSRGRRAVVVQVLERNVLLTMREREQLFKRFGGTPEEFRSMVAAVIADGERARG